MEVYHELYLGLFNAITDALRDMDKGYIIEARMRLAQAQYDAEERYICASETPLD